MNISSYTGKKKKRKEMKCREGEGRESFVSLQKKKGRIERIKKDGERR